MAQSEPTEAEDGSAIQAYGVYRGLVRLQYCLESYFESIDNRIDAATRGLLLATGLPLIDGVFPSIVLSGTLNTFSGMLVTAGTIFGGPWMLTIVVSEMSGDPVSVRLRRIVRIAIVVVPAAGLVAVLAPTLSSLLAMDVFHVASAAVLFTVGSSIANDGLGDRLPAPKWIVFVGSLVSVGVNLLTEGAVSPTVIIDPILVLQATATALLAFVLATGAAIAGPRLDGQLRIERFRIGSGIALALVPLSIAGVIPSLASLAVFLLAGCFALQYD